MAKTVLAVDDSASIRQMVAFTLKSAGYQVVEAVDGEDAREGEVDCRQPRSDGPEHAQDGRAQLDQIVAHDAAVQIGADPGAHHRVGRCDEGGRPDASMRIQTALDNVAPNVMVADKDCNIINMDKSIVEMFRIAEVDIRKELPQFQAAQLLGANIDVFHKQLRINGRCSKGSLLRIGQRRDCVPDEHPGAERGGGGGARARASKDGGLRWWPRRFATWRNVRRRPRRSRG